MYWRDICYVFNEKTTLDPLHKPHKTFTRRRVIFCNKKSVRQSEFYQAQAQGYRPEIMLEVRTSEYNGETHIEFKGIIYRVIRTYDKNGEIMELVVNSTVVNNGG